MHHSLTTRREALEAAQGPLSPTWEETGELFEAAYHEADLAGRRALLASMLEAVTVQPGRTPVEERATIFFAR